MEKSKITIANDSCNGQENEFAEFLRAKGFCVTVEPALRSTGPENVNINELWDEFCRS